MADNAHQYGFRWSESANGAECPKAIEGYLASGFQGAINGGSNIDVNIGDPVRRLSTGYYDLCDGSEGGSGGESIFGIVVGIGGYKGANNSSGYFGPAKSIPGGTTYTAFPDEASKIYIVPVWLGLWEIDCDDAVTATTYAAYHAFLYENCDHVMTTGSEPKADPMLDISGHGTGAAQWRIMGISKSAGNIDFSGAYVKLIVACNETQNLPGSYSTTGV